MGADYIVGDATIALARHMEKAVPGQILIGDFARPAGGGACDAVDTMAFIARSQRILDRFVGIELSGERVSDIRCYLTGPPAGGGPIYLGIQATDLADFDASITVLGPDPLPPPGAGAPGTLRAVAPR